MEHILFLENTIIKYDENSGLIFESGVVKKNEVIRETKCSFSITVDGPGASDRNFLADPYFKIYDGGNVNNSNNVTRIKVFSPEYVIHDNQKWNLNSKYKKALNTILSVHDYKNWKKLLEECIKESNENLSEEDKIKFMKTPMPDYTKLKDIK